MFISLTLTVPPKRRTLTAGKHVKLFIEAYWRNLAGIGIAQLSDYDDLSHDTVNSDGFVGKYLHWLAIEGRYITNPSTILKLNSILSYASSVKEYYVNTYCNCQCPGPYHEGIWCKYFVK